MTAMLNIFAILTAFLGIYLGFREAIKGIVVNILTRFMPQERINQTVLHYGVYRGDSVPVVLGLHPLLDSVLYAARRAVIRRGFLPDPVLSGLPCAGLT